MQGYFLPTSTLILTLHGLYGSWKPTLLSTVLWYFAISLPAVILAIILGRRINRRFAVHVFVRFVYAFLLVTGVMLLVTAWGG